MCNNKSVCLDLCDGSQTCLCAVLPTAGWWYSEWVHSSHPIQCPLSVVSMTPLQGQQLMETLGQVQQQLGPPGCNPPKNRSCQEILYCFPSAPSGYYQIRVPNGSLVQVYCYMEGTNCTFRREYHVDSLVVVHTLESSSVPVWRTLCSDILQDHSGHRESVLRGLSVSVPEGRWHQTVTC